MRRGWCMAVLAGLVLAGGAWGNNGPAGEAREVALVAPPTKGVPSPGRWEYRHRTTRGNVCVFVLNKEVGTADYVFNGIRLKKGLEFRRFAQVGDCKAEPAGWVYQ